MYIGNRGLLLVDRKKQRPVSFLPTRRLVPLGRSLQHSWTLGPLLQHSPMLQQGSPAACVVALVANQTAAEEMATQEATQAASSVSSLERGGGLVEDADGSTKRRSACDNCSLKKIKVRRILVCCSRERGEVISRESQRQTDDR